MGILQLIAIRNYITVNKDLIRILGLDEAILIGELASEYDYWYKDGTLEDGYFYSTVENIKNNTTLTDYQQRKALSNLQKRGLIDIKIKGIPARRYMKINENELVTLINQQFSKNLITSNQKSEEQDVKKVNGNNNIINNNNIYNINNSRFRKPSLDEIKSYIQEKDLKVDANYFYDYFETGNWKDSKGNQVKNWKQKLLTWNRYSSANKTTKQEQEYNVITEDLKALYDN